MSAIESTTSVNSAVATANSSSAETYQTARSNREPVQCDERVHMNVPCPSGCLNSDTEYFSQRLSTDISCAESGDGKARGSSELACTCSGLGEKYRLLGEEAASDYPQCSCLVVSNREAGNSEGEEAEAAVSSPVKTVFNEDGDSLDSMSVNTSLNVPGEEARGLHNLQEAIRQTFDQSKRSACDSPRTAACRDTRDVPADALGAGPCLQGNSGQRGCYCESGENIVPESQFYNGNKKQGPLTNNNIPHNIQPWNPDSVLVKNLPQHILQDLEIHLDPEMVCVSNWRHLASKNGVKNTVINYLKQNPKGESPTSSLWKLNEFKNYTVQQLKQDLAFFQRFDCVDELDKTVQDLLQSQDFELAIKSLSSL